MENMKKFRRVSYSTKGFLTYIVNQNQINCTICHNICQYDTNIILKY